MRPTDTVAVVEMKVLGAIAGRVDPLAVTPTEDAVDERVDRALLSIDDAVSDAADAVWAAKVFLPRIGGRY